MISSNQQRCHGTDPTHRAGSGFVEVLEGSPSLKARWGSPVPSGVIEVHRSVALRTGNGQPWARAANLPVVQDVPRFPDISPLYLEWLYYIWLVGQGTWMDYDFPHFSHHLGNFIIPSDEVHDQPDIYKAHFLGLSNWIYHQNNQRGRSTNHQPATYCGASELKWPNPVRPKPGNQSMVNKGNHPQPWPSG